MSKEFTFTRENRGWGRGIATRHLRVFVVKFPGEGKPHAITFRLSAKAIELSGLSAGDYITCKCVPKGDGKAFTWIATKVASPEEGGCKLSSTNGGAATARFVVRDDVAAELFSGGDEAHSGMFLSCEDSRAVFVAEKVSSRKG